MMTSKPIDAPDNQVNAMYAYCLRFFSELQALGITTAVISPGSRSTPLVLSAEAVGLELVVHLDERSAAFHALGTAKVSGVPSVLVCSSGTAAANYLPAVIEANHSQTPMIICTADRPPELRQWGAGQTINQVGLYGENIRWGYDLPVVSEVDENLARSVALRAWSASTGRMQGPVHLNWPFREPLEPSQNLIAPEATLSPNSFHQKSQIGDSLLSGLGHQYERGLITVGPNSLERDDLDALVAFSSKNGWPILADPCSQLRDAENFSRAPIITSGELLLAAEEFTSLLDPVEVIVHVGLPATSKAYRLWNQGHPPERYVLVSPAVDWADPSHKVTDVIEDSIRSSFSLSSSGRGQGTDWCQFWVSHNRSAVAIIEDYLGESKCELSATAQILSSLPSGAALMLSNSMAVRDAELVFRNAETDITVVSNRGANGIDGIISTGVGASTASDGPCLILVGDVAAAHDVGGLIAAGRLQSNVVIVVIDNGGGAIFSFLPVAQNIDKENFDSLFTTPHNTNFLEISSAAGIKSELIGSLPDIEQLLVDAYASDGPKLFIYRSSVEETVKTYESIRTKFQLSFREG